MNKWAGLNPAQTGNRRCVSRLIFSPLPYALLLLLLSLLRTIGTLNAPLSPLKVHRELCQTRETSCARIRIFKNGTFRQIRALKYAKQQFNPSILDNFRSVLNMTVNLTGELMQDFDIDISTNDNAVCPHQVGCNGGLIGHARNPLCPSVLALPIHDYQLGLEKELLTNAVDPYRFDEKISVAIWRGAPTGYKDYSQRYVPGDYHDNTPRERIVEYSKHFPNILNASFEKLPMETIFKYKVIVAVSGNSWSSILKAALLSNSCVLVQDAVASEWYELFLEPWKQFIPVHHDLHDLIPRVEWALQHEKECRQIAQSATSFAKHHFTDASIASYVRNELQKFAVCGLDARYDAQHYSEIGHPYYSYSSNESAAGWDVPGGRPDGRHAGTVKMGNTTRFFLQKHWIEYLSDTKVR